MRDTKDLANEFVDENINMAHTLKKFEFLYHLDNDEKAKKYDVRKI